MLDFCNRLQFPLCLYNLIFTRRLVLSKMASTHKSRMNHMPHAMKKAIDQYDLDNNLIDSFTSIADANRSLDLDSKKRGIRHHIDKGTQQWQGFRKDAE